MSEKAVNRALKKSSAEDSPNAGLSVARKSARSITLTMRRLKPIARRSFAVLAS